MSNQQLNISASQPLRLRNPTPYHLMATNNSGYSSTPHPLADIEVQQSPFQQQYNRESPTDQQQNHIEFNDSFSQNLMHGMSSPLANEFEDHHSHNPMYDNRGSFSSTNMNHPMDIHRRSSTATDISIQNNHYQHHNHQQPVFIPGTSLDSSSAAAHSLAMSAPANMGYEYTSFSQHAQAIPSIENVSATNTSTSNSLARSFEDDYTVQMNMQLMMEKRRRRRESHNAVERRRRDNINDRIQELCSLLPETALESTNLGPNNKPNKGAILRKSVDHIRQLQHEVQSYHQRVEELESTLKMYQQQQQQQQP